MKLLTQIVYDSDRPPAWTDSPIYKGKFSFRKNPAKYMRAVKEIVCNTKKNLITWDKSKNKKLSIVASTPIEYTLWYHSALK